MTCASGCGTRWLTSAALAVSLAVAAPASDPAPPSGWPRILASAGLDLLPGAPAFRLLEGDSPQARALGFRPTGRTARVASIEESRDPQLEVVWEKPLELPVYAVPAAARIFARDKWTGAPLVAGLRDGAQAVLWTAAVVGEKGYERFPYLLQALADLGVGFPFRGARTWAFFDYSYRMRADSDFLARRWRQAGIAAIHVAAWHFYESDQARDTYLRNLIDACHRQGILVYAWLELPHVSDKFWEDHPQWREKTAILQDAQLDWRKLINLADPDCARAVDAGLQSLASRFDWDGVNLAELYFESLYGPADPQRLTPMNDTARAEFRRDAGFDPIELFRRDSPHYWEYDPAGWRRFAEYRVRLANRLQEHWLDRARTWRPQLDLVVTQIDDRFDATMRDNLGADAASTLRLAERFPFTLLIEDPATVWHLGPERYAEIARRYGAITPRPENLAVDLNIVERYQDVYPTKKQTGTELFELVHQAAQSFARVALYFERSIAPADYDLLAAASATVRKVEPGGVIQCDQTAGVRWKGPVRVDGRSWPVTDGETTWLPAGRHRIESDAEPLRRRVLQLNADLLDARPVPRGVEFQYHSTSRAIALVSFPPTAIQIDGKSLAGPVLQADQHYTVLLPAGRHTARLLAAD